MCTFSCKSDGLAEVTLPKMQPNAGFPGVTTTKPRKYACQLRCNLHASCVLRPAAAKNTSVSLCRAVQIALVGVQTCVCVPFTRQCSLTRAPGAKRRHPQNCPAQQNLYKPTASTAKALSYCTCMISTATDSRSSSTNRMYLLRRQFGDLT